MSINRQNMPISSRFLMGKMGEWTRQIVDHQAEACLISSITVIKIPDNASSYTKPCTLFYQNELNTTSYSLGVVTAKIRKGNELSPCDEPSLQACGSEVTLCFDETLEDLANENETLKNEILRLKLLVPSESQMFSDDGLKKNDYIIMYEEKMEENEALLVKLNTEKEKNSQSQEEIKKIKSDLRLNFHHSSQDQEVNLDMPQSTKPKIIFTPNISTQRNLLKEMQEMKMEEGVLIKMNDILRSENSTLKDVKLKLEEKLILLEFKLESTEKRLAEKTHSLTHSQAEFNLIKNKLKESDSLLENERIEMEGIIKKNSIDIREIKSVLLEKEKMTDQLKDEYENQEKDLKFAMEQKDIRIKKLEEMLKNKERK